MNTSNEIFDHTGRKFQLADNVKLVTGIKEWAIYKLNDHDIIRISPDVGQQIQTGNLKTSAIRQLVDAGIFIINNDPTSPSPPPKNGHKKDSNIPFRSAWLELTNACNLRCSHCYMNAGQKKSENQTNWLEVLEYLATHNCRQAIFIGGEPLCHPDFLKYLEFAKRKSPQMRLCVVTNGTLWNKHLLERMKELDVFLKFSLLGSSPSRHDSVSGVAGSFDTIVKNIDLAILLDVKLEISTTLVPSSHETVESMERFVSERFGDVKHSTTHVRPQGRQVPCGNLLDVCSEDQLAVHVSKRFFDLSTKQHPCLHGKAAFSYSGQVHPCIMSRFEKIDLATVLKQKPEDVFCQWWTLTKDQIEGCRDCALRYACFDCRGFAASMTTPPCNCRLASELYTSAVRDNCQSIVLTEPSVTAPGNGAPSVII